MTSKEAFHFGFLLRCAEEGLSEGQTAARMEKAAVGWADLAGLVGSSAKDLIGTGARAGLWALPIAGVGAYGAGHLAGGLAAASLDPGYTPEEINRRELLETYSDLADALENRVRSKKELG